MKKKTLVHAFSVPDVNTTTKVFSVSQKTRPQQTVISSASTRKSLTIGVNKGKEQQLLSFKFKVQ